MKQYCPICKQMYESDTRFCPECDVVMYKESVYLNLLKNNAKMKVITHKKVDIMMPLGITLIVVGVLVTIACGVIASSTEGTICAISGMSVNIGIALAVVGICYISNYLNYTAKEVHSNENNTSSSYINNLLAQPTIECPYCHSVNVSKIDALNRTGSILLLGMASGKIGKQWHCNNCKSDF